MSIIGIFGGTFDPIHNGHLHVAQQVLDRLALDQVHFLPCAIPVHRGVPRGSAVDRMRMIELALEGREKFKLNTLELNRDGKSYMVDTLREIRAGFPGQTICLILGADAFNQLKGWKSPREILQLAHLVVCRRPDVELDRAIFPDHWVESPALPGASIEGSILPLEIDENPCSSTKLRDRLEAQDSEIQCLHPAVFEYIQDHHLYH